jgi:fatty acid desaturase
MKKTRSTKIDDISFFSVKQTSIRLVVAVMLCSFFLEAHSSLSNVEREELLASQNNFQNRISSFESASSKSASESTSSRSVQCFLVVVFVAVSVVVVVAVLIVIFIAVVVANVFVQHLMTLSAHSN